MRTELCIFAGRPALAMRPAHVVLAQHCCK